MRPRIKPGLQTSLQEGFLQCFGAYSAVHRRAKLVRAAGQHLWRMERPSSSAADPRRVTRSRLKCSRSTSTWALTRSKDFLRRLLVCRRNGEAGVTFSITCKVPHLSCESNATHAHHFSRVPETCTFWLCMTQMLIDAENACLRQ